MRLVATLLIAATSITVVHAEETNSSRAAIVYGLEKATLIVSGSTQGSAAGGGGTTSRLKVEDVFLGDSSFKGKLIAVFWLSAKANQHSTRIWFLTPRDHGYEETVGTKFPFVEATAENVTFLRARVRERQKPNQVPERCGSRAR